MATFFTREQVAIIRQYRDRGPNVNGDYSDAYRAIAEMLPEGSSERRWLEGATLALYFFRHCTQRLKDATGATHGLSAGMRVIAEIRYGERTVTEYLLSPLQRTVHDAGRER